MYESKMKSKFLRSSEEEKKNEYRKGKKRMNETFLSEAAA